MVSTMKFIDETTVHVQAGKGGDGCMGFRREKFIPFGGPDGGDGGDGGSVILVGNHAMNTLVDYYYKKRHKAKNGDQGGGSDCRGRSGEDLLLFVPVGTMIHDDETEELLGDITEQGQQLKVAQGGFHGLGNARFKSSTNRAPRKISKGSLGEVRRLRLELKLIADVGLVGLPNAGKSTLIRAVSAAKPKVADYAFTTLVPNLGVVRVDEARSFVIADLPGLIEGAAEGVGLGIRFLKHVARTHLLLHLVDVAPFDQTDPIEAIRTIEKELAHYHEDVALKPRCLVLNKVDLIDDDQLRALKQRILDELKWQGDIMEISAIKKQGVDALCYSVADRLDSVTPL
jgi:GTP-binding protein